MSAPLPMTPGRIVALVIGVPLAMLVIGSTAVHEIAWAAQASYPVSLNLPVRGGAVTIAVDSGRLRVGPTADDRLRLTGTAHYSIARSRVTWSSTASGVSVNSQCRFPMGPCSFDYQIAVPAGRRAVISDSSGDLTLRGLSGPVHAELDSGNVRASGLSGAVTIEDNSGDITVTGLTSRQVTASADSGDITLTFTGVPDRVLVSDLSGDVRLVLPRGSTFYRVNARTSDGHTTVRVPHSPSATHVITVTNLSGNISITQ